MAVMRHAHNYSYEVWSDTLGEHLKIVQTASGVVTDVIAVDGYDGLRQLRDDLTRALESALVD